MITNFQLRFDADEVLIYNILLNIFIFLKSKVNFDYQNC